MVPKRVDPLKNNTTSVQPLTRSHEFTAWNGAVILEIVMTLKYRGVEYTKSTK